MLKADKLIFKHSHRRIPGDALLDGELASLSASINRQEQLEKRIAWKKADIERL